MHNEGVRVTAKVDYAVRALLELTEGGYWLARPAAEVISVSGRLPELSRLDPGPPMRRVIAADPPPDPRATR